MASDAILMNPREPRATSLMSAACLVESRLMVKST